MRRLCKKCIKTPYIKLWTKAEIMLTYSHSTDCITYRKLCNAAINPK